MLRWLRHVWRRGRRAMNTRRARRVPPGARLHVGCGSVHLDGWINIDVRRSAAAALALNGVLRLSTPNLDWICATQYHYPDWASSGQQLTDCFAINKSFHAWGHRFLYNLPVLEGILRDAGFAHIAAQAYGESAHPELCELEHHERSPDQPSLPHVIIVEASGRAAQKEDATLREAAGDYMLAMGVQ